MSDLNIWRYADNNSTIDHILERYHQVHRRQFEEILPLAEKVSGVHAGIFPGQVLPLLQNIQAELQSHMMKEEQVLFPMIKQGAGAGAAMPVRMMMHEHDEHQAAVAQLLDLTDKLTPPENACRSWRRLYAELQIFVDDLNDHITLENEILFPRVLAK